MIQNTSNKPLSELYSADNSVSYSIPKYQPEYISLYSKWFEKFKAENNL